MMMKLLLAACLAVTASAAVGDCDLAPIIACHNAQEMPPNFADQGTGDFREPSPYHECCGVVKNVRSTCPVAGVFEVMTSPAGMDPVDYYNTVMGWLSSCPHSEEDVCINAAKTAVRCVNTERLSGSEDGNCCMEAADYRSACINYDVRFPGHRGDGSGSGDNDDNQIVLEILDSEFDFLADETLDLELFGRYFDEERDNYGSGDGDDGSNGFICPEPYGEGSCDAVVGASARCINQVYSADFTPGDNHCCRVSEVGSSLCEIRPTWEQVAATHSVSDEVAKATVANFEECDDDEGRCEDRQFIPDHYFMGDMIIYRRHGTEPCEVVTNYQGSDWCRKMEPMMHVERVPECAPANFNHNNHN